MKWAALRGHLLGPRGRKGHGGSESGGKWRNDRGDESDARRREGRTGAI